MAMRPEDMELSKIGAGFVKERAQELLTNIEIIKMEDVDGEYHFYREGIDLYVTAKTLKKFLPTTCKSLNVPDDAPEDTEVTLAAAIEVKTRRPRAFLTFKDKEDYERGTYDFELWKSPKKEGWGNLYEMFYPIEAGGRSAQPLAFMHILTDSYERPFACIAFEDFYAFKQRLTELVKPYLDFDNWPKDPKNPVGWDVKGAIKNGLIYGNMIRVHADDVFDLATITIIGEDPKLNDYNNCKPELVQSRLDYLVKMAKGRHIPQTKVESSEEKEEEIDWSKKHPIEFFIANEKVHRRPIIPEDLRVK